jgi:pyruvate/2-oxoglutarate dehydrogenase complex dihydrolipoamide acyltransferase (E2) component
MRRATLVVLIVLALTSAASASACGYYWGRCGSPCGYTYGCLPCYGYTPYYCAPVYYAPAACEPVCCDPCGPVQTAPSAQPRAAEGPMPTLAPPPPAEKPAAAPPTAETKAPAAQPTTSPASSTPPALSLPAELPVPSASPDAPRAAEGGQIPSKSPSAPAGPKARPVEQPLSSPEDKPLVAFSAISGDPFLVETDQLQIWTDATGNYRVEARFISFDERTVRLQRANGQYLRVEYDRLSNADRQRVQDLSLVLAMKTSMK